MRRAGFTFACVLALVFAGAAQASSASPRDFEMRAPTDASAALAGSYKSHVLRAPKRFDLVGMRWRGPLRPTISLRARKRDGRWTKWTRVPADSDDSPDSTSRERPRGGFSAPVWTGDADHVQYKLSRRVSGLRLHFVDVPSTTRRALASRTTQTTGPGQPAPQPPGSGHPAIQPRAAWGAEACVPREPPVFGDVQAAFVHHTVSANDYTPEEVPSIILSICRYHRNSNGWNDIGYNFLVDKFGTLWEGRAGGIDQGVVGAQAQGFNSQSTGIANIGTFDDVPETDAAMNSMAQLIRWKLPLTGAPTAGAVQPVAAGGSDNRYPAGTRATLDRVSGHRDVDATDCPGGDLYSQLPTLRALVGSVTPVKQRTRLAASF